MPKVGLYWILLIFSPCEVSRTAVSWGLSLPYPNQAPGRSRRPIIHPDVGSKFNRQGIMTISDSLLQGEKRRKNSSHMGTSRLPRCIHLISAWMTLERETQPKGWRWSSQVLPSVWKAPDALRRKRATSSLPLHRSIILEMRLALSR